MFQDDESPLSSPVLDESYKIRIGPRGSTSPHHQARISGSTSPPHQGVQTRADSSPHQTLHHHAGSSSPTSDNTSDMKAEEEAGGEAEDLSLPASLSMMPMSGSNGQIISHVLQHHEPMDEDAKKEVARSFVPGSDGADDNDANGGGVDMQ